MNNKFDVIDYINSSAIADYCRRISYRFSYPDMAYLIWASRKHSLAEKHTAWKSLIDTQPDTQIQERPWTPYIESLHGFLRQYMKLQSECVSVFLQNESGCVYSYCIRYPEEQPEYRDYSIFSDFQTCLMAVQTEVSDETGSCDEDSSYIQIRKQWICKTHRDQPKYMKVHINPSGRIMGLDEIIGIVRETDFDILDAFRGMWPEIPAPFRRGDVLISRNDRHYPVMPFVLEEIMNWEGVVPEKTLQFLRSRGDESDLCTKIYCLTDSGSLCLDHGPCYLDMEYYRGEFTGKEKFLPVLSGFLKGEYDVAVLLEAYDYLKNDSQWRNSFEYLAAFRSPHLSAAGFKEELDG